MDLNSEIFEQKNTEPVTLSHSPQILEKYNDFGMLIKTSDECAYEAQDYACVLIFYGKWGTQIAVQRHIQI